ncbi:MAG: PBP1A family penicillin-binding protein, partial [Firmicutes bacterium]|nr:PBP1A family penicillin-binding protein [Bacillota bacterium]
MSDNNNKDMNPSENISREGTGKKPLNKGGYDSIYYSDSPGKGSSTENKRPKRRPRPQQGNAADGRRRKPADRSGRPEGARRKPAPDDVRRSAAAGAGTGSEGAPKKRRPDQNRAAEPAGTRSANPEKKKQLKKKPAAAAAGTASAGTAAAGTPAAPGPRSAKKAAKRKPQRQASGPRKRKRRSKKITFFKFIKITLLSILLAGIVAAVAGAISVAFIINNAEEIDPNGIYTMLAENSVIYDGNGDLLEKVVADEMRTNLDYAEMPTDLVNAFVAIEDKTFWKHKGFNFVRIAGALWESFRNGDNISGTSTITQQLARNVFLPESKSERTMVRKITEAYYTVILEHSLTKEQIVEAYLNTIYLGFNAYGVEAASQTYFNKSVDELNLAECTALATIPKNPSAYALIKRYQADSIDPENTDIIGTQDEYILVYNSSFKDRQKWVVNFMEEEGYITQEQGDAALAYDLRESLRPPENMSETTAQSTYFTDYAKDEVVEILQEELGLSATEAKNRLYTGGLSIYTTLDVNMQGIVEAEYVKNNNFPGVSWSRKDSAGNIVNKSRQIMLFNYNNFFNEDGSVTLDPEEFSYDSNGNLYLYKDHKLAFAVNKDSDGNQRDISISLRPMYLYKENRMYITAGGTVYGIDPKGKVFDSQKNLIILKETLDANPNVFAYNAETGKITIAPDYFTLIPESQQPQSAMVIIEQSTGQIKAMVGGRNIEGSKLYNRADSPRQPGSSIKPLAVYTPAIIKGYTGSTITPDTPNKVGGRDWPKNAGGGYKGNITMRAAVMGSVNVVAVRTLEAVGIETSYEFLQKLGITTLVDPNDKSLAALGLGGLTRGLKPVESAGAYATIANGGIYKKPTTIAKILDRNGDVIYECDPDRGTRVIDDGSAFLMTDILRSAVSGGTGSRARIYGNNSTIPVAGKTGTTSSNYDAWFCGFTPYYTASLWIGNDYNIQLTNGSGAAAALWSNIMRQVHSGLEAKSFEAPDSVYKSGSEWYVKGRTRIAGKPDTTWQAQQDAKK